MPILEERQPKQRLTSESGGALAPANLGSAETRAAGDIASEILKLGDEFSSIGLKLDQIQRNDEYVKGQLAYGEMYSEYLVDQEKDPDYAGWPKKFAEKHRKFAEHYVPSMRSSGAQKDMDAWLEGQLNNNSATIGINAARHLAASRRASIPGLMNRALADAVAAQSDEARQAVRDDFKKKLADMVADGSLYEGAAATDLSEYDRRLIHELVEDVKRKRQQQISMVVGNLINLYEIIDETTARLAMEQDFATGDFTTTEQLEISRRLEDHIAIREDQEEQRIDDVTRVLRKKWVDGTLTTDDVISANLDDTDTRGFLQDIRAQYTDPAEDNWDAKSAIVDATDAYGMGDISYKDAMEIFDDNKKALTRTTRSKLHNDLEAETDSAKSYHRQTGYRELEGMLYTGPKDVFGNLTWASETEKSQMIRARTRWEIEINEQVRQKKFYDPAERYARCRVIAEQVKAEQITGSIDADYLKKRMEGKTKRKTVPLFPEEGELDLKNTPIEEIRAIRKRLSDEQQSSQKVSSFIRAFPKEGYILYHKLSQKGKDRINAILVNEDFAAFQGLTEAKQNEKIRKWIAGK